MRFSPKLIVTLLLGLAATGTTTWWWRAVGPGASDRHADRPARATASADASPVGTRVADLPGARPLGSAPAVSAPAVSAPAVSAPAGSVASGRGVSGSPRIALRAAEVAPAADAEWRRTLAPRAPLPKEPLVSPPGRVHQLTVKLSDRLAARPGPTGELIVSAATPAEVAGLARVADAWALTFRPTQTASEESLRRLQDRAAQRTGRAQPDLGGIVEAILPDATPERVLAAAAALHALPEVEFAEIRTLDAPPPPPADIAPPTPSLVGNQTYRQAATGVNVDYVWTTYGIRGAPGLLITDCEYQYRPTHEDLAGLITFQSGIASMYTAFGDDHGTAVLGILAAGDNGYGMSGSLPVCTTRFYPEFSTRTVGGTQSRSATVTAAVADSEPGDIVVLEMQDIGPSGVSTAYTVAEYVSSVWTAVKTGTDAGVIVIAAAGNGAEDLDSAAYLAYRNRGDSGAIIVGAGTTARARQSFSTYGARVNVQGWGGGVATTGYGTLAIYGSDANQKYSNSFSGTSSATPVVTSAAGLLQSVAIEILGRRLAPAEVRTLLRNTGRAQTGDLTKLIGPLPELSAAVTSLLASEPPTYATLRSWGFHLFATATPALTADPDGDGLENLLEYLLGTDPKAAASADLPLLPVASTLPGPGLGRTIRFEFHQPAVRTGASWQVESTPTLNPPDWQPLIPGTGGVTQTRLGDTVRVEIFEPAPTGARFLRLKATAL